MIYFIALIIALVIVAIVTSNRQPAISSNLTDEPSILGTSTVAGTSTKAPIISRNGPPKFFNRHQNVYGVWGWFEDGLWVQDIVQDMLDEVAYMALFDDDGMFMDDMLDSDSDIHSDDFAPSTPEIEPIAVNETPTFTPVSEPVVDSTPEPTPSYVAPSAPAYEAPSTPAPSYDAPSYSGGSSDSGGSSSSSDSGSSFD